MDHSYDTNAIFDWNIEDKKFAKAFHRPHSHFGELTIPELPTCTEFGQFGEEQKGFFRCREKPACRLQVSVLGKIDIMFDEVALRLNATNDLTAHRDFFASSTLSAAFSISVQSSDVISTSSPSSPWSNSFSNMS